MNPIKRVFQELFVAFLASSAKITFLRKWMLGLIEKKLYGDLVELNLLERPKRVQLDKFYSGRGILFRLSQGIEKGLICFNCIKGLLRSLIANVFFGREKRINIADILGFHPPMFITLSPTNACNLKCTGCYANAMTNPSQFTHLNERILNRTITEAEEKWKMNFFVISGGEPLLYRSNNKGILDLVEAHPFSYFLMYTNSTLITKEIAKRMAKLGNITPAISVEGLEKETDARRGQGVTEKILEAMANLREVGVPFGISATATSQNAELLVSDEFYDFWIEEQGALYGWYFHMMPIGRATIEMMPSPKQRLFMFSRERTVVRDRKILLVDFWCWGTASDGCVSSTRRGGYFYIDWKGRVFPCVFVPYYVTTLDKLYSQGKNLEDVWNSPLFRKIREWQEEYGYSIGHESHECKCGDYGMCGDFTRPCFIRDHFKVAQKILSDPQYQAIPVDEDAAKALSDPDYFKRMDEYDQELANLFSSVWQAYLNNDGPEPEEVAMKVYNLFQP